MAGKKNKYSGQTVTVYEQPPELSERTATYWVEPGDFAPQPLARGAERDDQPYLIIGFDTEFKTPDYHVTRDQIEGGQAKYRVLSYQFYAKHHSGQTWQGICCTKGDDRMSMQDFILFALGVGARNHNISLMPTKIYLVGHFTRADIPAFSDFDSQKRYLSNVRNTFITIDRYSQVRIDHGDGTSIALQILIRDTMLLTPQASKSLRAIGDMLGFPKLALSPDRKKHKHLIANMDFARQHCWENYQAYALMDAEICVRYADRIIKQYEEVTGKSKMPVTLTSIGVDLLLRSWNQQLGLSDLEVLGKEKIKERWFDKTKGYYKTRVVNKDVEELHHNIPFITECYHGGRNEQYWFGPGFEDQWIDIDLAGAYPTAMSLIGKPDWRSIRASTKLQDFQSTTLGFAWVDFEFPQTVRYPSLPVRTENGLVFPLKGTCYCAAPELFAALRLGCKIKIRKGLIVPADNKKLIFGEFIKECIQKRNNAGSKTLEGLFWKEISNSTYGKTAQGLRVKRVYDMRNGEVEPLPPSRITNPCFAAYITSFVRALLGEVLNTIDSQYTVFSCTTDGFLTNFPSESIPKLVQGPLAQLYSNARARLTGDPTILEIKHEVAQPLGWRTRGQATLKRHDRLSEDDRGIVLAKGGIFTRPESETLEDRNQEVTDLFWTRTPDSYILVESLTGVRDIVEHDADLVTKEIAKRLSMEYDWKRKPSSVDHCDEYDHVFFTTVSWDTVEQFKAVREAWTEYTKKNPVCIKKKSDVVDFFDYVECVAIDPSAGKYLRRAGPDINRLRQMLCSAWHQQQAGITKDPKMTANQFAAILQEAGIPCKRTDVENGKKKPFIPNHCPGTQRVKQALKLVKTHFPKLKTSVFLIPNKSSATSGISFN